METAAKLQSPISVQPVAKKLAGDGTTATEKHSPPTTTGDGQAQLALALELLQKNADSENQAKAAQLLWQAVERGNVAAEVDLANLYLLGQGVARSCGQARVLLTAAQTHKSELAGQKLDDFPKYGCE
jgi:TPR repeat protein